MLRRDEIEDVRSCLSKADDDEMIFVLLARDAAAPAAINAWIAERIRLGLDDATSPKIVDAQRCIAAMEETREEIKSRKRHKA